MIASAVASVMVTDCAAVNEPPLGEMTGVAAAVGVVVEDPPPPQPASITVAVRPSTSHACLCAPVVCRTQSVIKLSPRRLEAMDQILKKASLWLSTM